mgnify:CR=1 FL=1
MKKSPLIWNILAFQITWFSIALSIANDLYWPGISCASIFILSHLIHHPHPLDEIKLIARVTVIGVILDSALLFAKFIEFKQANAYGLDFITPWWMIILWLCFGSTISTSLAWLKNKLILSGICGGIGGVCAYWGGYQLGAISHIEQPYGLIAIGVLWAIAFPQMLKHS